MNIVIKQCRDRLNTLPFPFADFMEELGRWGFVIGVDHYFQVLGIVERFGREKSTEDLKYMLCPVFATHEKQQDLFYRLYDKYFNCLPFEDMEPRLEPVMEEGDGVSGETEVRKPSYVLAGLLWIILIALMGFQLTPAPEIGKPETTVTEPPAVS